MAIQEEGRLHLILSVDQMLYACRQASAHALDAFCFGDGDGQAQAHARVCPFDVIAYQRSEAQKVLDWNEMCATVDLVTLQNNEVNDLCCRHLFAWVTFWNDTWTSFEARNCESSG